MSAEEGETKEEQETAEEEQATAAEGGEEREAYAEYKVSSPELLQIMLDAFEILEKASEGSISITEAKALYEEKVDEALKKQGEAIIRRPRRRTKAAARAKKVAAKKGKKSKRSRKKQAEGAASDATSQAS